MKVFFFLLLLALQALLPFPAMAQTAQDAAEHPSCKYCNMNRKHFAHSRTLIEYDNNTSFGGCSIHCAALDLSVNSDKLPLSIKVADYDTRELIDAETAHWVIGGNRPGVMTLRAKWAFRKKEDAEKFVARNGGHLATFDEILEATYTDMYEDTKMIRAKRKIRRMHQ